MAGEYGTPPASAAETLPGIWEWDNPGNKFHVVRLHYSADPDKGGAWVERERPKLPRRAWETEFEISFATGAGKPVFPEFDAARMVRTFPILPIETCRIGVGWDFGHDCPCCGFYQVDRYGRLRKWGELILDQVPLETLIEGRNAYLFEHVGQVPRTFDAGDPSAEKMTDLGAVRKILAQAGITLHTSYQTRKEASYTELRSRFMRTVMTDEGPSPAFLVHPRCSITIAALQGNFHLREKPPHTPVDEHPWKDVCDETRYFNSNLRGVQSDFVTRMRRIAGIDAVRMGGGAR